MASLTTAKNSTSDDALEFGRERKKDAGSLMDRFGLILVVASSLLDSSLCKDYCLLWIWIVITAVARCRLRVKTYYNCDLRLVGLLCDGSVKVI